MSALRTSRPGIGFDSTGHLRCSIEWLGMSICVARARALPRRCPGDGAWRSTSRTPQLITLLFDRPMRPPASRPAADVQKRIISRLTGRGSGSRQREFDCDICGRLVPGSGVDDPLQILLKHVAISFSETPLQVSRARPPTS